MVDAVLPSSVREPAAADWFYKSHRLGVLLNDSSRVSKEVRNQVVDYMIDHMKRLFHESPPHPLVSISIRECDIACARGDDDAIMNVAGLVQAAHPFLNEHESFYLGLCLIKALNQMRASIVAKIIQESDDESGHSRITPSA